MHEILAPILFVLYFDQQAHEHAAEQQTNLPIDKDLFDSLNSAEFLEHDAL